MLIGQTRPSLRLFVANYVNKPVIDWAFAFARAQHSINHLKLEHNGNGTCHRKLMPQKVCSGARARAPNINELQCMAPSLAPVLLARVAVTVGGAKSN